MKNIKKAITAATLMMVLMVGTSFGGIIITSSQNPQPCTEAPVNTSKSGVILSDATGIIITSVTGIIITSVTGIIIKSLAPTDCGIIITS
ncbi:MAG TPA: hypothetical protein VF604_07775 [Pyrinomonadaceae bacterium]|jgi:hypothetical protein